MEEVKKERTKEADRIISSHFEPIEKDFKKYHSRMKFWIVFVAFGLVGFIVGLVVGYEPLWFAGEILLWVSLIVCWCHIFPKLDYCKGVLDGIRKGTLLGKDLTNLAMRQAEEEKSKEAGKGQKPAAFT